MRMVDRYIEYALNRGSGFANGKDRIYKHFQCVHSASETAQFLKQEYGLGGCAHMLDNGLSFYMMSDAKGLKIQVDEEEIHMAWAKVAEKIRAMIGDGHYVPDDKTLLEGGNVQTTMF